MPVFWNQPNATVAVTILEIWVFRCYYVCYTLVSAFCSQSDSYPGFSSFFYTISYFCCSPRPPPTSPAPTSAAPPGLLLLRGVHEAPDSECRGRHLGPERMCIKT